MKYLPGNSSFLSHIEPSDKFVQKTVHNYKRLVLYFLIAYKYIVHFDEMMISLKNSQNTVSIKYDTVGLTVLRLIHAVLSMRSPNLLTDQVKGFTSQGPLGDRSEALDL